MKNFPTISVVMATYNSQRTIERSLGSIREQEYPQKNITIIIADGGSTDRTKKIASQYRVHWISTDPNKQGAEYNKSIALSYARGDIVAFIDHDNILPHKRWFQRMVVPFGDNKNIVGVETLRYHYDPTTSLLDRYFALFGAGDPLVFYLGKTDRLSYLYDTYSLAGVARDCGDYYIVCFSPDDIPTIGANGFLVRRSLLISHARTLPGEYFDMDVNVDLIRKGYCTYAFVKNSILHLTGYGNLRYFLKRRWLFITQYRFNPQIETRKNVRRYGSLSKRDTLRLIYVIVVCATGIVPLWDSIRGWRKIHDSAWFIHPLLCVSFVAIYSWAIIRQQFLFYAKKLLET